MYASDKEDYDHEFPNSAKFPKMKITKKKENCKIVEEENYLNHRSIHEENSDFANSFSKKATVQDCIELKNIVKNSVESVNDIINSKLYMKTDKFEIINEEKEEYFHKIQTSELPSFQKKKFSDYSQVTSNSGCSNNYNTTNYYSNSTYNNAFNTLGNLNRNVSNNKESSPATDSNISNNNNNTSTQNYNNSISSQSNYNSNKGTIHSSNKITTMTDNVSTFNNITNSNNNNSSNGNHNNSGNNNGNSIVVKKSKTRNLSAQKKLDSLSNTTKSRLNKVKISKQAAVTPNQQITPSNKNNPNICCINYNLNNSNKCAAETKTSSKPDLLDLPANAKNKIPNNKNGNNNNNNIISTKHSNAKQQLNTSSFLNSDNKSENSYNNHYSSVKKLSFIGVSNTSSNIPNSNVNSNVQTSLNSVARENSNQQNIRNCNNNNTEGGGAMNIVYKKDFSKKQTLNNSNNNTNQLSLNKQTNQVTPSTSQFNFHNKACTNNSSTTSSQVRNISSGRKISGVVNYKSKQNNEKKSGSNFANKDSSLNLSQANFSSQYTKSTNTNSKKKTLTQSLTSRQSKDKIQKTSEVLAGLEQISLEKNSSKVLRLLSMLKIFTEFSNEVNTNKNCSFKDLILPNLLFDVLFFTEKNLVEDSELNSKFKKSYSIGEGLICKIQRAWRAYRNRKALANYVNIPINNNNIIRLNAKKDDVATKIFDFSTCKSLLLKELSNNESFNEICLLIIRAINGFEQLAQSNGKQNKFLL